MQTWNAADYVRNASFVPAFGEALFGLITAEPPARILDLGCGDGVLSQQLLERGYEVVAVDSSPAMVEAARQRIGSAQVADGHALRYQDSFHVVFSNAALHWMTRPDEVIAGVHRALRPGGEFVGELGGAGNVAAVVGALSTELDRRGVAAPTPWYFPSPAEYATKLERAGFRVEFMAHFDRPTPLPGDVLDWVATFGERFTNALADAERPAYLRDVRARLTHLEGTLDYVRLRFRARKRAL